MTASVFLTALLVAAAPVPAPKPEKERYGDAIVDILKGATRVEIFRLIPDEPTVRFPVQPSLGDYAVSVVGKEQGEPYAVALGKVLLDDARLSVAKPRINSFEPWIGFRLWKGKENVEVLFDPRSRNLQVTGHDANGTILKQTLNVAHATTCNALLKRAQEAFPEDVPLRRLGDVPER
jgi:hypothetical protein